MSPVFPLQVFFDGSCSLCVAQMEKYRAMEHGGRLVFVDIGAPGFDPAPYGISLERFMYEMHCIDRNGRTFRGVEGFRAIWRAFPDSRRYTFLAILAGLPGINAIARLIYWCFARLRRYLPRNRDACKDGRCRIGAGEPRR